MLRSQLIDNMILLLNDLIGINSLVIWLLSFIVISRCSILEVSCVLSFHIVVTTCSDLVLDGQMGSFLLRKELLDLFDSAGLHTRFAPVVCRCNSPLRFDLGGAQGTPTFVKLAIVH